MIAQVSSCGLMGVDGFIVQVETDIANGLPSFDIVGLPDAAVRESKERVRAAIKNADLSFPVKKITINLAPAHIKKEGASFDLPISMAILAAAGQVNMQAISEYLFIGELSLNGELRKVNGALPIAIAARNKGFRKLIVPQENAHEAAAVKGIEIYPAKTLRQIVGHLTGKKCLAPFTIDVDAFFSADTQYDVDFSEVKGQENIKRGLEVAAAGGHNLLMIGSPGAGKTMIAKRVPTILPDMTFEEALEVTKIHSVAGLVPDNTPIITTRVFRSPHHTISNASLVGGGRIPRPGEMSLAHHGVLFLDELPEFKKDALEVMRQPLEDGIVTISRVSASLTYPCNTMLIASMNPCKCGFFGDPVKACTCTPLQIQNYLSKISGPLLDRMDIQVQVAPVKYQDLQDEHISDSSFQIKQRVNEARERQLSRYKKDNFFSNAQLSPKQMEQHCILGAKEKQLLQDVFDKMGLSARAYHKILKVARTIADLEGAEKIGRSHLAEAIQYRSLDQKFWK